jgi:hypothetical protein
LEYDSSKFDEAFHYEVEMKMNFSSFEKTWDDNKVYKFEISKQPVVKKEEASTSQVVGQSVLTTAITSTILSIALTGASSQVWGLINGL